MSTLRQITGTIVFPPDALSGSAAQVRVELRDTSLQDQASTLLASQALEGVNISAGLVLPFSMKAPEAAAGRSLSLRVQVDLRPDKLQQIPAPGSAIRLPMLLSTTHCPVPAQGEVTGVQVNLEQL